MKAAILSPLLAVAPLPAVAGGLECSLSRECSTTGCFDVAYSPYIDMNDGKIVLRGIGTEIALSRLRDGSAPDGWRLFADLPQNGLLVIVVNPDDSAAFTTFSRRGDAPRVVTVTGTCEARG